MSNIIWKIYIWVRYEAEQWGWFSCLISLWGGFNGLISLWGGLFCGLIVGGMWVDKLVE